MSTKKSCSIAENETQDRLKYKAKDLNCLFIPKSVAIVGASSNPAKIGHQILRNMVAGRYAGEIYPIHPKEDQILEKKVYHSVLEIPGEVDLVVISVPASLVIGVMEECAKKKVKGVAVITSGFSEVGNVDEEKKLKEIADKENIALVGPNIFGIVYSSSGVNASFGPESIFPGKIAFISQSGALSVALMGWTEMEKIGLASLVSIGNKADIGEKELIEHFNNDPNVDVILIYMEGLKDGRKFLTTEIRKPVVVLKVGRSESGAKAAASHTGSLAGLDKVFDAAFRQLGVLRANTFIQAFGWSRALSLPFPTGKETIVITNGGGIGVATADECETAGVHLLNDPKWLEEKFRKTMPSFGSTKNPIDITGQGKVDGYRQATRIAMEEDRINTIIVLYCEVAVTHPVDTAKAIYEEYEKLGRKKPIVVTMVGGIRTREAINYLNEKRIPAFRTVDESVSAIRALNAWKDVIGHKKDMLKVDSPPDEVVKLIENIKSEDRTLVLEHEARKILELCGVPTPKWGFAKNVEEALVKAKDMYPLAIKVTSPDIVHKTDMGGVALNIRNEEELRLKFTNMMNRLSKTVPQARILGINLVQMVKGIECIVGLSRDPQFGPVIMFGLGGVFVETLKDVSFRVVPFGQREAERLIGEIKGKEILEGFRGFSADKPSIIHTLCAIQKISHLVKEIDINPLITRQDGSYAVDARIIL